MLTIITVNLNNNSGLQRTIDSVIHQQGCDIEYIIIDGGSTDGSVNTIEQYKHKLKYFVSEPDKGVYHAMNKGIAKATGEYILFLNSGDYLVNETILSEVFRQTEFTDDLVYGNLLLEKQGKIIEEKLYPGKLTFNYFYLYESLPHPSSFIRRKLFERIGLYNENYKIVSDWEFYLKALFLHQATYCHIPISISVFNLDGVSSIIENNKIINTEKAEIFHNYFRGFIDDYHKLQGLVYANGLPLSTKIRNKVLHLIKWKKSPN